MADRLAEFGYRIQDTTDVMEVASLLFAARDGGETVAENYRSDNISLISGLSVAMHTMLPTLANLNNPRGIYVRVRMEQKPGEIDGRFESALEQFLREVNGKPIAIDYDDLGSCNIIDSYAVVPVERVPAVIL